VEKAENTGMSPFAFKEILQLSVAERVQLAEDIWDSIVASPESLPVTGAQKQELDRRRDAHATNTAATRSWDEIRAKLSEKG
jgi:putative addiction module component (TIGR02574 family)